MAAKPDIAADADDGSEPELAGYWQDSARPLESLLFVAPLLVTYEVGVLLGGGQVARNGADVWLRHLLDAVGFGQFLLLPLLAVGVLLGWHHLTRQPWRVSWAVLPLMAIEAALWAAALLIGARLLGGLTHPPPAQILAEVRPLEQTRSFLIQAVGYLGAGIYEELLFRVLLLTGIAGLIRLSGQPRGASFFIAGGITAFLFAAAHYLPGGETFVWGSLSSWSAFVFRFAAGAIFAGMFLFRGFGITAGSHALYDILARLSTLA